jgi:hypothetical protein
MPEENPGKFFSIRNAPGFVIAFLLIFYCLTNLNHRNWASDEGPVRGVIKWDVISYYGYLPAVFIYHDLSLDFTERPDFVNDNKFWYQKTEKGKKVIITSMGLSYLYAPFFFAAHLLAPVFGETRDGFQSVYQFFLVFSALFYVGFGFFFLWKLLVRYFSPVVSAVTLLLIGMGTNLYYYSTHEAAMSHAYNFSLIALFLYLVCRWYDAAGWKNSLLLGVVYGLIVLIRPSNFLLIIPLLLWEVDSWGCLMGRIRFLVRKTPLILLMLGGFLLPWIPQLLYWKEVSGSFLYNSYSQVGSAFYFDNPHLLDFLFSYRKGWFVYTPLMLFAVLGFIPLYRVRKGLFYATLIYLGLMIYVFSSWWSWWTGGSFGIRSMVDLMAVMSLPLAALTTWLGKSNWFLKIVIALLLAFTVFLNIFQTKQYQRVLIHGVGMTKKSYWTIFLRLEDRYGYWQNLTEPDYELARKGIYVFNPVIGGDERLKDMPEEEGKSTIRKEISGDRRLGRDLRRYCRRTGAGQQETLDMVVDRIYQRRLNH